MIANVAAAVAALFVVLAAGGSAELRTVRVKMTNQSRMRAADLAALLDVANSIWTRNGVSVEPGTGPGAIVVVLCAGRNLAPQDSSAPVLGTTLFGDGHALPFISLSLAAAEALAADSEIGVVPFRSQPPGQQNAALIQMLGVALAHELAHYLLDTKEHASTGLLRPSFNARELIHPVLRRLGLTPQQEQRLHVS
jgi:hypothetical protein